MAMRIDPSRVESSQQGLAQQVSYDRLSAIFERKVYSFEQVYRVVREECAVNQMGWIRAGYDDLTIITDVLGRSILVCAIEEGERSLSQTLVRERIALQVGDQKGNFPLHYAAQCGDVSLIGAICACSSVDPVNLLGKTPLLVAIDANQIGAVEALVVNRSNKELCFNHQGLSVTPLMYAVMQGKEECIESLSRGEDLSLVATPVGSLLHLAVQFRRNKVLGVVLQKHPILLNCLENRDLNGNTPLALSVLVGNPQALYLLHTYGADLEPENHQGLRPLHLAVQNRNELLVAVLVYLGCQLNPKSQECKRSIDLIDRSTEQGELTFAFLSAFLQRVESLEHDFEVPEMEEDVAAKKFLDVVAFLNKMGTCYKNQGNVEKALEHFFWVLKIEEEVLGESHVLLVEPLSNIGFCYLTQGSAEKALKYFFQALEIKKKNFEERAPSIAVSWNNIGACHRHQGNVEEAIQCFSRALEIKKEAFGLCHPEVAVVLSNIGCCYIDQEKFGEALKCFSQVLQIETVVFRESRSDMAVALHNMGICYKRQGNLREAVEHFSQALQIVTKNLGEQDSVTLLYKKTLEQTQGEQAALAVADLPDF